MHNDFFRADFAVSENGVLAYHQGSGGSDKLQLYWYDRQGTQLDPDGRQRNPHLLDYKLVTASDAPRIDVEWIETPAQNGGPKGSKGVGEPPCVPTARAIRSRSIRNVVPTPRRARFFITSLPSAPAPTTRTFAAASRS